MNFRVTNGTYDYARLKKTLLLLLLALFSAGAFGGPREVRIGAGADVYNDAGMLMGSFDYRPASLLVWEGNFGAGLSYNFGPDEGWNAGIGGILVGDTDELTGTHLNALLRVSYCGSRLCLSFSHISHGSRFGIYEDKPNRGLNFLYVEYRVP